MRPVAWLSLVLAVTLAVAACGKVEEAPVDAGDQPDDAQVDSPDGMVITTCTPNQFVDCDGGNARICNASGDGATIQSCGAPGCNPGAMRCNACVPSSSTCDGAVVESCGADGLALPDETCQLSCTATPSAHCAYISPRYLPNVCDGVAAMPGLTITTSGTIDTALDASCTGGVVTQVGGPPICVMRYGVITVQTGRTLTLIGGRAAALVADGDVTITGTIDGSATGLVHGPGGGTLTSGGLSTEFTGGGGAGHATAGAAGGSTTATGGAANGGATSDPLAGAVLVGGVRAARPSIGIGVSGGGGGGAVMLVSCRGTVAVTGTLDVGGGGGNGGRNLNAPPAAVIFRGGGGGGTGGYAVLQGLDVRVTGEVYANGGGGGGGGSATVIGGVGGDGTRSSTVAAAGGQPPGGSGSGVGGAGGRLGASPGGGGASGNSQGGGGGSTGAFQSYTPTGVTPTLTPSSSSPGFQTNMTITTR